MKRQAQVMCGSPVGEDRRFRALEVDDDLRGLVVLLANLAVKGAMGMEQLVRDVSQNSGAAGREAAFGDQDEQPGEGFGLLGG